MARKPISGNKQLLKIFFKEVVEQIDEEHLATIMENYREKNLVFVIGENSRGRHHKVAFSCFTVPHSEWKLYTPQETIQIQIPLEALTGGSNN
ncbi:MAG: hypothetical protein WA517_18015 [Candidatus Acidiferrum sp.]